MKLESVKTSRINVPNDPDGGYINIKNLTLEEIARIDSKYFEIKDSGVSMVNYAGRDGDFAKACLTGWGNLYDESGRELKFNPKNIEKASAFVIDVGGDEGQIRFYSWVNNEREKLVEEVEAGEAEAEKN